MSDLWPLEISLKKDKSALTILFENGDTFTLSAEYLRTHSQSAEVKGHGPGQETLVTNKKNITIEDMETVGNYAIKIIFSDGHETGLFTWQYLYDLGDNFTTYWPHYLEKLSKEGSKR